MRKVSWLLAALVLLSSLLAPCTVQASSTKIYRIDSAEDLIELSAQCRLDSFSENLRVVLAADIDLSNTAFESIPTFSGEFDGRGHSITGLELRGDGSVVGLFRYLTVTAVVDGLNLHGILAPGGSAVNVGGIAGINAGTITNCSFSGIVNGSENIGGIAGTNMLTGLISDCSTEGTVYGTHFVGGIAGTNYGVIRNADNNAQVNTVLDQNKIQLENITMDTITGTEHAGSVTDIGGICGVNEGVISSSTNRANVGYPKVGYNIGGIAGRCTGYINACTNTGSIQGRKDIGGITGQLEPAVSMLFEEDTLQILQGQIQTMSDLAGVTSSHIENTSDQINVYFGVLDQQMANAQGALELLLPDSNNPQLPDEDTLQAAQNILSGSLSGMSDTLGVIGTLAESSATTLSKDLNALSGQMSAIGATLDDAGQNLGANIQDVSDLDTEADTTAKLYKCTNLAQVSGDWNLGGICGTIGPENDLDPESDLLVVGNASANFDLSLRAVVLRCENSGSVSGNKQNIGGIAGLATMGLIRQGVNRGDIAAQAADYVGGIAGHSEGFIRNCAARSYISASNYTGGIAGQAATVTDCYSLVSLSGNEYSGAVLGFTEKLDQVSGNYYLPVGRDIGAVDGISYAAHALALDAEDFFNLAALPSDFDRIQVTFRFEDGSENVVTSPYGFAISPAKVPVLPGKTGYVTYWDGAEALTSPLYFDCVYTAVYTAHQQVLASDLLNAGGQPRMLVLGQFPPEQSFCLQILESDDALCAWRVSMPQSNAPMTLRLLPPEEVANADYAVQVARDEAWVDVPFTTEGSYLVIDAASDIQALRLVAVQKTILDYLPHLIAAAAAVLVIIIAIVIIKKRKKAA